MNCRDIDRLLMEDGTENLLPPQFQAHVADCERCRELLLVFTSASHPQPPSPATLQLIQSRLAADLKPVRTLPAAPYLVATLLVIFLAILLFLFRGLHMQAFGLEAMSFGQTMVIFAILTLAVVGIASSLVNQMVPGSRQWINPGLLLIGTTVALVAVVAALFPVERDDDFLANAWICLKAGTQIGMLAAVPFWLVLRRGAILSPVTAGASAGLLAGLVGVSALEAHCPYLDFWHITASHIGAALLCSIAGLLIGFGFLRLQPLLSPRRGGTAR